MGTRGSVVTGIMDQMLTCFSFPKCYIDDIIIFSLTLRNHNMHDLQEVFGNISLNFILANVGSFTFKYNIFKSYDLFRWIGNLKDQD
jgi:hypothetical protein